MVSPVPVRHRRALPPVALPQPRGPVTERLLASLREDPHDLAWRVDGTETDDEDLHLGLYCCYELHYQGLPGVPPGWEWEPSLLSVRRRLEERFEADLKAAAGPVAAEGGPVNPGTVVPRLWEMATAAGGPSLSAWVVEHATFDQLCELAVHRSAYQLKEADPHTWAIPRLAGEAKAAMVAIQADEYGNGVAARMHAALFADTMATLGLDATPNRYLDQIPGVTLATTNLISLLGLHRRWRGAIVGHLALFEMTSIGPMGRYAAAFRRLGLPGASTSFYDVHVEVDEIHQQVAADRMVGGLLRQEPDLAGDILFGAAALEAVESRFASHILHHWEHHRSSLRPRTSTSRPDPPG